LRFVLHGLRDAVTKRGVVFGRARLVVLFPLQLWGIFERQMRQ
jgi:hypothetical protein